MHVRVLRFGILKEWLGPTTSVIELREGSTVLDLWEKVINEAPDAGRPGSEAILGVAVGVNAEFVLHTHILHDGDEVALLPPVSGGAPAEILNQKEKPPAAAVALVRERIGAEGLIAAAKRTEDGAVVVFDGIVRNHSRGRRTLYLDYEAYEKMALRQMHELAAQARSRFAIRHVTLVHRLGRLEVGETSVLVIVAAAHRAAAFEASRWLIDTLKQTVPIWKKETFADGAVWAPGEPFPESLALNPAEMKNEL